MLALADRNTVLHLIDYLKGKGMTDNGICGLLGNLYAESGVRTNNLQNSYEKKWNVTDESYTSNVDRGTWKDPINGLTFAFDKGGYGLAQWTSSGRKSGLLNLAHEMNKSIADETVQFEWLWTELTKSYRKVYAELMSNTNTLESCAEIVVCGYEKPASVLSEGEAKQNTINKRVGYAKDFYSEFFGNTEGKNEVTEVAKKNIVVAINAGHYIGNPKRVPENMPVLGGTKEFTLNNRVVQKFAEIANGYEGIEVLLNYDTTGNKLITLDERIAMAEKAKADIYLSIHHNAGINGGTGGGMTVFYYSGNATNQRQATSMYNEIKARTGLKGNRSTPIKGDRSYIEVYKPTMNSYIVECAFMDSITDVYYIAKDEWPTQVAEGLMAFLVKEFGFTKKANSDIPKTEVPKDEEPKTEGYKVKISKTLEIYKDTTDVAVPGIYTIVEEKNGMGKLKSGKGWITLSESTKV